MIDYESEWREALKASAILTDQNRRLITENTRLTAELAAERDKNPTSKELRELREKQGNQLELMRLALYAFEDWQEQAKSDGEWYGDKMEQMRSILQEAKMYQTYDQRHYEC